MAQAVSHRLLSAEASLCARVNVGFVVEMWLWDGFFYEFFDFLLSISHQRKESIVIPVHKKG
jgi:hypothetical protein